MLDIAAQVGLEQHVCGGGTGEVAVEFEAEFLNDLRARAVGTDQVAGAHRVDAAGAQILQLDRHAAVVLGVREVFGVERRCGTAFGGVFEQHRLEIHLRNVEQRARAALEVVADAALTGAPGADPPDLLAGQAGREQGVTHQLPRGGVARGLVLDAEIAQHLDGALIGDMGARAVGQPVEPVHQVHPHAVGGEGQGGRRAHRAGTDDQNIGVECVVVHDYSHRFIVGLLAC